MKNTRQGQGQEQEQCQWNIAIVDTTSKYKFSVRHTITEQFLTDSRGHRRRWSEIESAQKAADHANETGSTLSVFEEIAERLRATAEGLRAWDRIRRAIEEGSRILKDELVHPMHAANRLEQIAEQIHSVKVVKNASATDTLSAVLKTCSKCGVSWDVHPTANLARCAANVRELSPHDPALDNADALDRIARDAGISLKAE